MTHWSKKLRDLKACQEAVDWAATQKTPMIAWAKCPRGDWMLWLLAVQCKTKENHQRIVFTAAQCARLALRFVPSGENRPLKAIKAAEKWSKQPTRKAAWAAARAAWAATEAAEHKKCADIVRKYFPKPPRL